jgi:MtN3 and saliva related transmembrane protein
VTASILGIAAATFSVVSFAPQCWRIIKTRDTSSLSTPMWIATVIAFAFWIAYGATLDRAAIVVPNAVCLAFALFILVMKLAPRRVRGAIADKLDPDSATRERT